ncbi:MAG TPA: hypothetical protein VGG71_02040, partial [Chitinophagaceae bacterium]
HTVSVALSKNVAINLNSYSRKSFTEDENNIGKRFAKVFEQSYTRFLDLQKAEAQAREAQIEAALEKVRSRSLAMHKSDELQEVVNTVFERFKELNVEAESVNIAIFKEGTRDYDYWIASPTQKRSAVFHMPYIDSGIIKDLVDAREHKADFFLKAYSFAEKNELFELAFQKTDFKFLDEHRKKFILDAEGTTVAIAFSKNTGVQINRYSSKPLTETDIDILKRFSKVFEQAYIRFLDLQKAEAQAREAQIEAALERVRSKTMAMHTSNHVGETVSVMFDELKKLGIEAIRCGIGIMHEGKNMEVWTAKPGETDKTDLIIGRIDMNLHALMQGAYNGWSNKKDSFSYELKGDDLVNYFTAINNYSEYPVESDIIAQPSTIFHNDFYFSEGTLFAFTTTPLSEEARKIFKRFAGVFGQTYRRYLDLQKAEAQARESQIQLALERVRARTMAMHDSKELAETVTVLFQQFQELGLLSAHARPFFSLFDPARETSEIWTTKGDGSQRSLPHTVSFKENESLRQVYDAWKAKKTSYVRDLRGKELINYLNYLGTIPHLKDEKLLQQLIVTPSERVVITDTFFAHGSISVIGFSSFDDEQKKIMQRFAKVFEHTYTRFLDLQKAEAQARESQIEVGLERVRARTMAMFKSDELAETAVVVFKQMNGLGIPNRLYIVIINDDSGNMEFWITDENG